METKKAIITFDYELFLGRRTGTIWNSVLKPTEEIIKILKRNQAKAIFFVDALWLKCIRDYQKDDFNRVADQLFEITKIGSSVELHLHPQWLKAKQLNGTFYLNSEEIYRVQDLSLKEIMTIFTDNVKLLESITDHKPSCYRAGGWCIEPFNNLQVAFKESGIKFDFSVVPGIVIDDGKLYDYDFSKVPRLPFYKFSSTVNEQDTDGPFVEFPVSTYNNNIFYRIINKIILGIINDKIYGDGTGAKEKTVFERLRKLNTVTPSMLTLDKTSALMFRFLLKTHFRNSSIIVVVSHPKTVSSQSLRNLDYITKNYTSISTKDLNELLSGNSFNK